jgi:hypothetical protein
MSAHQAPDQEVSRSMSRKLRSICVLAVLGAALYAGTGAVSAASVDPIEINGGNPTCADFGGWDEVKADPPQNGEFTDGTLVVTISNFQQSDSGNPGSFDWASNIGVDAVFVKAGSDKHHLYLYDPESTGDTGLAPQAGNGNGISHISFCYDADEEPSSPPSTPPSEEPSSPPSSEPSAPPTGSEAPSSSEEPSPSGGVNPATGTPTITLPPTDALTAGSPAEAPLGSMIVLLGILSGIGAVALARRPVTGRR